MPCGTSVSGSVWSPPDSNARLVPTPTRPDVTYSSSPRLGYDLLRDDMVGWAGDVVRR